MHQDLLALSCCGSQKIAGRFHHALGSLPPEETSFYSLIPACSDHVLSANNGTQEYKGETGLCLLGETWVLLPSTTLLLSIFKSIFTKRFLNIICLKC